MRKAILLVFAPLAVMTTVTLSTPAVADANIKDVLGACDRTPGCSYSIDKKTGNVSGCSTGSGACFQCGQDRKCTGITRTGGAAKGKAVNIGGVNLPPSKAPPKGKGGSKKITGKNLSHAAASKGTGGTKKIPGKNVSHQTSSGIAHPQTQGPPGRHFGGGGGRHH